MAGIVFIVALLIGSFLNVCIYRIPREESIAYPPSHCPQCQSRLKVLDLIPVLSYSLSRGKCRYCGGGISFRYPLVEILNGLLWLLLYWKFGLSLSFIHYSLLSSLLLVITFIDLREQIIPDGLNLLGLLLGIAFMLASDDHIGLLPGLLGLVVGGGLFLLIAVVTDGAMGGGDIKLMAVLGFILGWKYILLVSFLAFILGAVISVFLMALKIKGRKDMIAFGPFIAAAAYLVFLLGETITNAYWQWIILGGG